MKYVAEFIVAYLLVETQVLARAERQSQILGVRDPGLLLVVLHDVLQLLNDLKETSRVDRAHSRERTFSISGTVREQYTNFPILPG